MAFLFPNPKGKGTLAPEAGGSADSRRCFQETSVKVVIILFPKETQACNSETAVGAQASSHLPATSAIPAAASGQGPECLGGPGGRAARRGTGWRGGSHGSAVPGKSRGAWQRLLQVPGVARGGVGPGDFPGRRGTGGAQAGAAPPVVRCPVWQKSPFCPGFRCFHAPAPPCSAAPSTPRSRPEPRAPGHSRKDPHCTPAEGTCRWPLLPTAAPSVPQPASGDTLAAR